MKSPAPHRTRAFTVSVRPADLTVWQRATDYCTEQRQPLSGLIITLLEQFLNHPKKRRTA